MKVIALCFLILAFFAGGVFAAGNPKNADKPVTHYIEDYDANNAEYSLRSDGGGPYRHGVNGDDSVIFGNVDGLTWGDRRLENGTVRTLAVTFSQENAVQPGDPGYVKPANPPLWGTLFIGGRFINKCHATGVSLYAMKAGDKAICPMHFMMHPLPSGASYRLEMGDPETQYVQVSCNAAAADGCRDWFINPIPVVNPDGTTSPGKTRARLVYFPPPMKGKQPPYEPNAGAFYLTFHVHVTRP